MTEIYRTGMNYKDFTLSDWIGYINGIIEDKTTLEEDEMRDLVEFLTTMRESKTDTWSIREVTDALKRHGLLEQESTGWIPVSRRMPEEDDLYFVTFDNGETDLVAFDRGAFSYSGVIAWCELPKPYKEE